MEWRWDAAAFWSRAGCICAQWIRPMFGMAAWQWRRARVGIRGVGQHRENFQVVAMTGMIQDMHMPVDP